MVTREQGRRRTTAVTVGLAAASLAGTLAVAATAYAKKAAEELDGTDTGTTTDQGSTDQGTTTDQDDGTDDDWQAPPGGVGGSPDDQSHAESRGSS